MDLAYFYEEIDGEAVLKQRVVSHKTLTDIKAMIANNRPQTAIELHTDLLAQHEQWEWLDSYNQYLSNVESVNAFNSNLPVIDYDEDKQPIIADKKELPTIPRRPAIGTGTDILNSINYYSDKFKKNRAQKVSKIKTNVDNVILDGDEESQTRLTRAALIMLVQKLIAVEAAILDADDDITTAELVTSLKSAVSTNPKTLWKAADNSVTELDCAKAIAHAMQAGTKQSDMWGMDATE